MEEFLYKCDNCGRAWNAWTGYDKLCAQCFPTLPFSTHKDNYNSDTAINIKTVGDLKELIKTLPDDLPVYYFDGSTIYNIEGEAKHQECIEHSGYGHIRTGLIFQYEG